MSEPAPPEQEAAELAARASEYESIHNRLFVLRIVLNLLILAAYLFSGASSLLAEGLRSRFGRWWPLTNGVYALITVFGFAALTFPLTYYGDFVIEHRFGLSRQRLRGWMWDFFKALGLELILAAAFFEVVYAFLRWTPHFWWIWATVFFVLFTVVLASVAPVWILPLFHKIQPLEDVELADALATFARQHGLQVPGVYRWGLQEKTATANAALAGLGRTRRIILSDTMLGRYSRDEILAVLAHEIGHFLRRDVLRQIIIGSVLAALGFYVAYRLLGALVEMLTPRFAFQGVADIAAMPVLLFCLFIFSVVCMPLSNTYSRGLEFAADAFAVRTTGGAASLTSALEKLSDQNLAERSPARWIEVLLHSHPSTERRIARARAVEKTLPDRRAAEAGSTPA